jgi:hypothetical protein
MSLIAASEDAGVVNWGGVGSLEGPLEGGGSLGLSDRQAPVLGLP